MNRRKLLSLLGMSPVVMAAESALGAQSEKKPTAPVTTHPAFAKLATAPAKITTVNPKGTPPAIQLIPMAARLDSLDGKTVYLVDTGFMAADIMIREVEAWMKQNMPSVTTVSRKKAGTYPEDDPKLWAEIKANAAACIMAIGH
jgi:hypothetical protein